MTAPRSRAERDFFVDSSAFFALLDEDEARHSEAVRILDRSVRDSIGLLTTNFVIAEAHALVLGKLGYLRAAEFLRSMDNSDMAIVRATAEDEARARAIVFDYTDKDFSLTDAISFAVMRRLGVGTAFTFDRDFLRFGFAAAEG